ncbi:hypothetical protein BDV19DRAFT_376869 [Aspergillus venezuelensis]
MLGIMHTTETYYNQVQQITYTTIVLKVMHRVTEPSISQSFIAHPDIAPLLSSLDVPPNKSNKRCPFEYTIPAIKHPSLISPTNPEGVMMDSFKIAVHVERAFPTPSLFPSGAVSYALAVVVDSLMGNVVKKSIRLLIPPCERLQDSRAREYFVETRSRIFNMPLKGVRLTDQNEKADKCVWEDLMGVGEENEVRELWEGCLPWLVGQGEKGEWVISK